MTTHPFHLVSPSPWPFLSSLCLLIVTVGIVFTWSINSSFLLVCGLASLSVCSFKWLSNVVFEATTTGCHTSVVQTGLRLGFCLLILSEIFFFIRFFWAYLHCALSPNIELGSLWPPAGLVSLSPFGLPLLNTLVLLTSAATLTWSHTSLLNSSFSASFSGLAVTILLGLLFTSLQCYEFYQCSFCISDSVYGSSFYMATGFHGVHVLAGTAMLVVCLLRLVRCHFSPTRHLGFMSSIWYWHFVDVIWLFLYIVLYLWGC